MEILSRTRLPVAPVDDTELARLQEVNDMGKELKGSIDGAIKSKFALIPDYTNQESINRITTNNGSWACDRDGFVLLRCNSWGARVAANNPYAIITFFINGKSVYMQQNEPYFDNITSYATQIYEVSKGDIIRISLTTANSSGTSINMVYDTSKPEGGVNLYCYYIPPKVIEVEPQKPAAITPDYPHIEATNRISTNNGSWTADRDGWVWLYASGAGYQPTTDNIMSYFDIYINGMLAFMVPLICATGVAGGYIGIHHGTILPISKGDTVRIYVYSYTGTTQIPLRFNTAMPYTALSVLCRFIPPKLLEVEPPKPVTTMPDYANMESTNRISANNGTWTADRNGYVFLRTDGGGFQPNTDEGWCCIQYFINGKMVHNELHYTLSGGTTGGYLNITSSGFFPISKGETIRIYVVGRTSAGGDVPIRFTGASSTLTYCHFIPLTTVELA